MKRRLLFHKGRQDPGGLIRRMAGVVRAIGDALVDLG
jgi:hypothetical protein